MLAIYSAFAFMLCVCLALLAFALKIGKKSYWIMAMSLVMMSLGLYEYGCKPTEVQHWLSQGKKHYDLMVTFENLGGIDGLINKIKAKIDANPNDREGWIILSKLYAAKQDTIAAKAAQARAQALS